MSVPEKLNLMREENLCCNCLRDTHSVDKCPPGNCMVCRKKHHTLLHADREKSRQSNQTNLSSGLRSTVILSTAVINIRDQTGNMQQFRVVLDSGSQVHFLTNKACKRLGLPTKRVYVPICSVDHVQTKIRQVTRARIQSRVSDYQAEVSFLIMNKLPEAIPSGDIERSSLNVPEHIPLADPTFYRSSYIDGIIGAQLFWDLLREGKVISANETLQLRNTALGWIVTGVAVVKNRLRQSFKEYNTEREQELVDLLKETQENGESLLQKQKKLTSVMKSLQAASEARAAEIERLTKRVHLLESLVETASIERKQLNMELAEARQEGANRNIEISRLATLLKNARAKIEELEQSRQEQATEWEQFQTDFLRAIRMAYILETEAQSELKKFIMENKAQRVKLRALETQLDKLNKANQTVIQQPQQRPASTPTETQHCVLTSVQQEIAADQRANISHQDSRPSVKCLIESIEDTIKQAEAAPGSRK